MTVLVLCLVVTGAYLSFVAIGRLLEHAMPPQPAQAEPAAPDGSRIAGAGGKRE
jgi:hypothetical protein